MSQRVFSQGMLSRDASYEIITKGPVGLKEVDAMIRKLKVDLELFAGDGLNDDAAASCNSGGVDMGQTFHKGSVKLADPPDACKTDPPISKQGDKT